MTETSIRDTDLRRMLTDRRREAQHDVQTRIRDERTGRLRDVGDDLERSDADIQEDLELALIQMRAETLTRIDEALVRLDAGQYGSCRACGSEIAERRLRALPFAVRCQACEERREQDQRHARAQATRRGALPLFADATRI